MHFNMCVSPRWADVYSVMVWMLGQDLPQVEASGLASQVFAVSVRRQRLPACLPASARASPMLAQLPTCRLQYACIAFLWQSPAPVGARALQCPAQQRRPFKKDNQAG
jgi:hypothetical protein